LGGAKKDNKMVFVIRNSSAWCIRMFGQFQFLSSASWSPAAMFLKGSNIHWACLVVLVQWEAMTMFQCMTILAMLLKQF
jgi:hypothetical protein